jgi:large subunit ribosomal protein L30
MAKIKIKQIKSGINRPAYQKRTLKALGFSKLNQVVELEGTAPVLGMIDSVKHLLEIQK